MKGIWSAVSGAEAQTKKLETISNNLANVDTNGFKKDSVTFKEHLTAITKPENEVIDIPRREFELKDFYHHHGNDKSLVEVNGTYTNHSQGHMTPTGNPTDVALEGDGFIEVLTPRGIRFTRAGNLKISGDGKLVTLDGDPILSKEDPVAFSELGGEDVPEEIAISSIPPSARMIFVENKGKLQINPDGKIFQGGRELASLSIVEFQNNHQLKKDGSGLYINPREQNVLKEAVKTRVHQGFLEGSNVNPIAEMSEMIKTNRLFETLNKVIKSFDGMEQKAEEISKVY
jgi:flagellar basal-body rod protein FlgG